MKIMRLPNRTPFIDDDINAFDSLLEQSFAPFQQLLARASQNRAQIAADVVENNDQFVIRLELPGVKRDEIDIQFNNQKLSIRVDHSTGDEGSKVTLERSFTVNQPVNVDQTSATLVDGILTIHLTKAEETKPRSIKIN